MQIGLSRQEANATLFGELLDLIAIHQVKHEGAKLKTKTDEDEFWELVKWR